MVATYTEFNPSGWRISLTLPVVNRAKVVVFMVAGRQKAERLKQVLGKPDSGLPAARVMPREGRLVWLVDREAASLL